MRLIFTTLIFFAQTYSVAQLAQSEHFGILQFAYCNGNEQQVFSWEQVNAPGQDVVDLAIAAAATEKTRSHCLCVGAIPMLKMIYNSLIAR